MVVLVYDAGDCDRQLSLSEGEGLGGGVGVRGGGRYLFSQMLIYICALSPFCLIICQGSGEERT